MKYRKELINDIISRDFKNNLDHLWVIMIENKIFCPSGASIFHDTRDQAWKHFYNEYHWRVKSSFKINKYGNDYWSCKRDETDTQIWNAFKECLFEECDFKIIQWKDAKKYVCSERTEGEC